jgi:hypothetical protein
MGQRLVVSEFPNDNPELHDGLVWACPTPCAPALPTLRLRPSERRRVLRPEWEARSDPRASAAPVIPPPADAQSAVLAAPTAPPSASQNAFDGAIEATGDLAIASPLEVMSAPSEAIVEAETFATTTVATETLVDPAGASGFEAFVAALASILAERGATRAAANIGSLLGKARLARDAFEPATKKALVARGYIDSKSGRPTPEFSVVAHAWRDVLDGTSSDLSACGSATLDVWGAELLAALLSASADELRRALRQRGVAAFGMLAAA